jgi:hypothetical protein
MDFKNGVINIQAAGYNGARTLTFFYFLVVFQNPKTMHKSRYILAKWVSVCNEVLKTEGAIFKD